MTLTAEGFEEPDDNASKPVKPRKRAGAGSKPAKAPELAASGGTKDDSDEPVRMRPTGIELTMDDVAPGVIAILRGFRDPKLRTVEGNEHQMINGFRTERHVQGVNRFQGLVGVPVKFTVVSYPFAVFKSIHDGEEVTGSVDLTTTNFCRCSDEYVRAVSGALYEKVFGGPPQGAF